MSESTSEVHEVGNEPATELTSSRRRRTEVVVTREMGDSEVYVGSDADKIVAFIASESITASSRRRRES